MEIIYNSTSLTIDAQEAKNRISFYIERDNFNASGVDEIVLVFNEDLSKEDMFKVDLSMSTFGYVRM
jgi:hypothetical protein